MPEHRAQRRDAGAARDEDEAAFFGRRWKGERSDRSLDVDRRAGVERQMVARGSSTSTPTSSSRERSRRASSGADAIEYGFRVACPCFATSTACPAS
jgi:hypothetical protein